MPTKAQFARYDRDSVMLDKLHDCDPDNWTVRVQSPGFGPPDYVGSSRWVCAECQAMVAESVTRCYGGYEIKQRGER